MCIEGDHPERRILTIQFSREPFERAGLNASALDQVNDLKERNCGNVSWHASGRSTIDQRIDGLWESRRIKQIPNGGVGVEHCRHQEMSRGKLPPHLATGFGNVFFRDVNVQVLDQDRLTRISILTGIFKALNILYSKKLGDQWIQLPNDYPMFEGESPLTYMIEGGQPAMLRVRQLLDARRGGR